MDDPDSTVGVRVAAAIPLLQAALEHAVTAAGLHLVPRGQASPATLRTPDQPATGAPFDISVDVEHITIAITELPSPDLWSATLNLLRQLLDGAEQRTSS